MAYQMQWPFITRAQAAFKRGTAYGLHQPPMMETEKNVDKVRKLVKIYCCLHIIMKAEKLNMDKETDKSWQHEKSV